MKRINAPSPTEVIEAAAKQVRMAASGAFLLCLGSVGAHQYAPSLTEVIEAAAKQARVKGTKPWPGGGLDGLVGLCSQDMNSGGMLHQSSLTPPSSHSHSSSQSLALLLSRSCTAWMAWSRRSSRTLAPWRACCCRSATPRRRSR